MRQVSMQQAAQRNAGGVRLAASPQDGSSSRAAVVQAAAWALVAAPQGGGKADAAAHAKQLIQLPKQADVAVIEEMH